MKPWKRTLISIFILFHCAAIPLASSQIWKTGLEPYLSPYLVWARLKQSWVLFGPEPNRHAYKFRVDIVYQDGSRSSWQRPYPPNWSFFERHLAHHYQKLDLMNDYLMKHASLRRDFCAHVLRLHWNESNPPVSLTLVRSSAPIEVPKHGEELRYDEARFKWTEQKVDMFLAKGRTLE